MSNTELLLYLFGISAAVFFNHHVEAIRGGDAAKERQFPYQAYLQSNGLDFCGASILSERFVLTAAHCFIAKDNSFMVQPVQLVAGTTHLQSDPRSRVDGDVVQVFVPKNFDKTEQGSIGDIAVLKLMDDLDLDGNPNLGKVQLPGKDEIYGVETAIVSGFGWNQVQLVKDPATGRMREKLSSSDDKMHFAEAKVLSFDQCLDKVGEYRPIMETQMCANVVQRNEQERRGTCDGDCGGPLVHKGVQIGVLSVGQDGCDEHEFPAIYTKVSDYLDFIDKAVKGTPDPNIRSTTIRIRPTEPASKKPKLP